MDINVPGEPCGLHCPACGHHAAFALVGGQAFCGNEDCRVFCWEPTLSVAENMADAHEINLGGQ